MANYINRKITFPDSNISIKILKDTIKIQKTTIYHCIDTEKTDINYSLKVTKISTSDKRLINSVNTEMFILVIVLLTKDFIENI